MLQKYQKNINLIHSLIVFLCYYSPMLKEKVPSYYFDEDQNCAETLLHVINDEYNLGLKEEDFLLVGGFGGGCGCGITCGALSASIAALGKMFIKERAHATEGFIPMCGEFVEEFKASLSSIDCSVLKAKNFEEGKRCIKTVNQACDLFEDFIKERS